MDEMERIAQSADVAGDVKQKLLSVIPEAFSEGKLDVAALQRALGQDQIIEGGERFALTWAGKGDAYKVLQTPTSATLRPQRDLSVNVDTALHTFVEGENLEVLKVLQKSYFGEVSFIYIDPPYNTGSDSFIYPDRFQEKREEYLKRINDLSDDGVLMREGFFQKNTRESGRFHSNWLSMMLPRLYIARNLLRKDGVIFISCDDNELHTLRFLMDEIMGEENFIAIICWKNVTDNNPTLINKDNEFILCYARTKTALPQAWKSHLSDSKQLLQEHYQRLKEQGLTIAEIQEGIREFIGDNFELMGNLTRYKNVDEVDVYTGSESVHNTKPGGYDFVIPHNVTGKPMRKPSNGYRFPEATFKKMDTAGLILYGEDEKRIIKIKKYLGDFEDTLRSVIVMDGRLGSYDFKRVFESEEKLFNNPKPVDLIAQLVSYVTNEQSLVLDMFAGSCTTGEAVMRLNHLDGGKRQFICCQLPENVPEGSAAAAAGYKTIAEIGRDRLRRVAQDLAKKAEQRGSGADLENDGFRSFVLTPSNFKQWRGDGIDDAAALAEQLKMFVNGEKDGAAPSDMIFELLLKFGQKLTAPVEHIALDGVEVFAIRERQIMFVMGTFSVEMIDKLIALKPREIDLPPENSPN